MNLQEVLSTLIAAEDHSVALLEEARRMAACGSAGTGANDR